MSPLRNETIHTKRMQGKCQEVVDSNTFHTAQKIIFVFHIMCKFKLIYNCNSYSYGVESTLQITPRFTKENLTHDVDESCKGQIPQVHATISTLLLLLKRNNSQTNTLPVLFHFSKYETLNLATGLSHEQNSLYKYTECLTKYLPNFRYLLSRLF